MAGWMRYGKRIEPGIWRGNGLAGVGNACGKERETEWAKEQPAYGGFYLFIYLFVYLFIYGCVGSSFLCEGFL